MDVEKRAELLAWLLSLDDAAFAEVGRCLEEAKEKEAARDLHSTLIGGS